MTQNTETIDLFSPYKLGPLELPNRIVMAPMTRNRAGPATCRARSTPTYYAQRASAGLIITEGTQISPQGKGYPGTPGIHSAEQVAGWKLVTDAVHAAGGRIFAQLWHVGRISHPSCSRTARCRSRRRRSLPAGQIMTRARHAAFRHAARAGDARDRAASSTNSAAPPQNAGSAGFDGVELHGANGYLIDQFLRDKTNQRTDRYGGSATNRARFLIEVTEALVGEWGADRVGVRLSPTNPFNDIADSNPAATFAPRSVSSSVSGWLICTSSSRCRATRCRPARCRISNSSAASGAGH